MPPENNDADNTTRRKSGKFFKPAIIIAAIVLLEGGMFAAWMMFGGPSEATAGTGDLTAPPAAAMAETMILKDGRAPNKRSGRLYMYDIQISIETESEFAETVQKIRDEREAFIRDRLRTIIARADPKYFDEPDLQTLKRQIGAMLTDVLGEGMVKQVLIPKCNGYMAQ